MDLNKYIDHTLLKADATKQAIVDVCAEAIKYNTASVCVNGKFAKMVSELLNGTDIKTCCVIGFPLGASSTQVKAFEAFSCIEDGAQEIDMVISVGAAKEHDWEYVENDIRAVEDVCKGRALLKVIIETCLLSDEEKIQACLCAKRAGADFVKTSTGFSSAGATVEDVRLMRQTVGELMGVKAAGGIRSKEAAISMIDAGATRIGASSSKTILG